MVILDRAVCAFPTFGPSGTGQVRLSGPVHIATIGKSDAEFRNFVCDAHTHTLYKWVNFRPKQFGCRIGYMQALQRWHRLHRSAYSCPCRAARLLYNARCVYTSSAWSSDRSLLLLLYSRSPWQQCRTVRIFSKQHLPSAIPPSTRGCFARPARYIHLIFLPSSGLPVRWLLPHNSNFVFFSLSLSLFRFIPLSPPASPAFPLYAENARRQQRQ